MFVSITARNMTSYQHRGGFWACWRRKSIVRRGGRKPVATEVRDLIRRLIRENVTWDAPRIHAELLKLGLDVSERTVSG